MLYGLAISQSDCRKGGPYQLPSNNHARITIHMTKVHPMDFGRVSSKLNNGITSWELFQCLLATHRKVNSRENDDYVSL